MSLEHRFIPAILPTTLYDKWGLRPINWMDPTLHGTPGYHGTALISYYHWKNAQFEFHPDDYIFGDSGGYSIATVGANISPLEVLHWQIKYCSVGVILDVPPFVAMGSSILGGHASSNWIEALRRTKAAVQVGLPLYRRALEEGEDFWWWGVVHGETNYQMQEWYEAITRIYPFEGEGEGWAMKPHPANKPPSVVRCLRFAREAGFKRCHFLQMTGIPALTTLFVLGPEAGLEYASYDSASSSFSGINRSVFMPSEDGLEFQSMSEKAREKGETHAREWLIENCSCPSCELMAEDLAEDGERESSRINEEYFKYRMIFHNTLIAAQVYDNLSKEAELNPEALLKEKLGNIYSAVRRAFDGRHPHFVALGTPKSVLDYI